MDVNDLIVALGKLTVQQQPPPRARSRRRPKRSKKRRRGGARARGGGAGAILGMVARGAVRWTPRLLKFAAKNTVKYAPRFALSHLMQSAAEDALTKEIKRRRAEDWTLLGSIRRAAAEKYQDLERVHRLRTLPPLPSYTPKAWAAKRAAHLAKKRAAANWQAKIGRAKARAARQQHLNAAIDRSRTNRGLRSLPKAV